MASTFVMAIDYIDLDKGRMGGYWAHAVVGTGGGRGTGMPSCSSRNAQR